MQCPKCGANMGKVSTADGSVDRCTSCRGLWFEMLEHEELRLYAKVIDIGDPEVGKRFNEVDRVNCPSCANNQLIRMVDPGQPHIWFESCPTCYGRFYDAGEFRDLSEHTLSDFFKRFRRKERR